MPLNVNEFRSQLKDSLPLTHYEMIILPPIGGGQEINLRTESVTIPGTAFLSVDNYSPYGNGLTFNIPYRYLPQEISVVHTIDQDGRILETFREWVNKIVDLDGLNGKFGAYYFDDYVAKEAEIIIFNRQLNISNKIKLFDVYPTVVEPVNMSWGQVNEIAKLNVSYRFTRFKIEK